MMCITRTSKSTAVQFAALMQQVAHAMHSIFSQSFGAQWQTGFTWCLRRNKIAWPCSAHHLCSPHNKSSVEEPTQHLSKYNNWAKLLACAALISKPYTQPPYSRVSLDYGPGISMLAFTIRGSPGMMLEDISTNTWEVVRFIILPFQHASLEIFW